MRAKPLAGLGLPTGPEGVTPREPTDLDAEALAVLMFESYRGTIDDSGETLDDARAEVHKLLNDQFGRFDRAGSVLFDGSAGLAAATILTELRGVPLVAFSMTSPPWKRRGLARAGLARVLAVLAARGEPAVDLIVTEGNDPAMALYRGMGFEIVETR